MTEYTQFEYILDIMEIPILLCDSSHSIIFANRFMLANIGLASSGSLCGKKWHEIVPSEDIQKLEQKSSDLREGRTDCLKFNTRLCLGVINRKVMGSAALIPGTDISLVTFIDKTGETKAQEMITKRLARESAVWHSLALLLCGEEIKASLESALERIASVIGAGEGFVFAFDEQMHYADIVGLWSKPEKKIDRDSLLHMPLEKFPWWISQVNSGGIVSIMDTGKLPPEASELKALLDKFEIRSMLVFPFHIKGTLSGFAGFGDLDEDEMLFEEDYQLLDTFAQAVKGSMDLRLTREESEKHRLHLDNLFDYSSEGVIFANETHKVIRANPAFLEMFGYTEEQVANFGMTFGLSAFILYMLFIIGELAYRSKAGKTGTFVLFFVLAFGMLGFVAKTIIEKMWGI